MNKSTLACTLSCCVALLFAACEGKHEIGVEAPDASGNADVGQTMTDSGQTAHDATTHDDAASTNDANATEDAEAAPDAISHPDASENADATETADAGATDAAECILAHDPLGPCNEGACPQGSLCVSGNCFGCANGDCSPCIGADQ